MRIATRTIAAALTALTAAGLLAACTGTPPAPSPHPTQSAPTKVVVPTSIPNEPALRKDVAMASCDAAKGGWGASGEITNSTGKDHDYAITILFTNGKATVIGVGQTSVKVAAGAKADWSVSAKLAAASPTLCVLSGVA